MAAESSIEPSVSLLNSPKNGAPNIFRISVKVLNSSNFRGENEMIKMNQTPQTRRVFSSLFNSNVNYCFVYSATP